jgi:hypothetical protein
LPDVTARKALSQRMHVLNHTLKGIHTECWPNDLDVDGPLSNKTINQTTGLHSYASQTPKIITAAEVQPKILHVSRNSTQNSILCRNLAKPNISRNFYSAALISKNNSANVST